MNGIATSSPDFLADVLAHIEGHLFSPLSTASLAEVAGLSPWHFSRSFTARLGESVMGYVRARRLEAAAMRLMGADPPKLTYLAFDCGFESQEAFTRAFKRRFGVPPGQFERQALKHDLTESDMQGSDTKPDVTMIAARRHREAFTVAGLRAAFDAENKSGIPGLWPRLLEALPLPGQVDGRAYGVLWTKDKSEGSVNYMASVEVKNAPPLPPAFETLHIPANDYAVFRIVLNGPVLHPQIQAAMKIIWGELIPKAGIKAANAPDFEECPEGFNPTQKGAWLDFHVAVE